MRPFFLRIVRKGKRNNNHTQRATRTTRIDKAGREDKQSRKAGQKDKNKGKQRNNRGKHATSL